MMKLVNEIDNANAWAVGRSTRSPSKAGLPTEIAAAMPAISWFSAAGHINGGVSGTFKAEAKDEATAKNLRDVMGGFLAMAKMQAGNKPGMQQLADSLIALRRRQHRGAGLLDSERSARRAREHGEGPSARQIQQ